MLREEALRWLKHRLEVQKSMGRVNHYDMEDVTFFMTFIYHRTGKRVTVQQVAHSIRNYSDSCMSWVDKLINYLIFTHNIEVITDDKDSVFKKVINYK